MISVYKDFDNPPKDLLADKPSITIAVKRELYELYHGKCAFTEEKITFDEMEVGHYRPIALYPELEFEWSNLLPVSKEINSIISHKFQLLGEKVNAELLKYSENRQADSPCLLAEKPLLLHPEVDTPENHFYYTSDALVTSGTEQGFYTMQSSLLNQKRLVKKRKSLKTTLEDFFSNIRNKAKHSSLIQEEEKFYIFFKENKDVKQEFSLLRQDFLYNNVQSNLKNLYPQANSVFLDKILYIFDFVMYTRNLIFNKQGVIEPYIKGISTFNVPPLILSIKGLQIMKKHSIKNIFINNIPINTRWVFLTGENGFGKTLILQSIIQALWKYTPEKNYRPRIILELNSKYQNLQIPSYQTFFNPYTIQQTQWCAYGANRLALSGYVDAYTQAPQKVNKTDSLFHNNGILYNIEEYLINLHNKPAFDQRKEEIIEILKKLLPSVGTIQIDDSSIKSKIWYQEKAEDGSLLTPIPFHSLSAGNKSIIAMIGDMIIELLESQQNVRINKLEGIVLIDEIDIHLHPKWQKRFVQTLTELFPNIQFIVSTHSPIPLLGAPKETVILNVEKPSKREGIKVKRLEIDVTTLTPNTILTSPIFGFEGIISNAYDHNEPLYTSDTYNDVVFEQHLDKKLDEFAENSEVNLDDLLNGKDND